MCISRSKAKFKKSLTRNMFLILSVKSKKNFLPFQGKWRHIIIPTANHGINESDRQHHWTQTNAERTPEQDEKAPAGRGAVMMSGLSEKGGGVGLHVRASNSLPSI